MSKEHGNSAECVKNVAQENRDFFMVEGPDGKPKISALSGAFTNSPTPEQIKEMQKGGVAVDLAMLNKMNMLAIAGQSKAEDPNTPAMVAMHEDMRLAFGRSKVVEPNSQFYDMLLAEEKAKVTGAVSKAVQAAISKDR